MEYSEKLSPWLPQIFIIACVGLLALLVIKLLRLELTPLLTGSNERTNEEAKGPGFILLSIAAVLAIGVMLSVAVAPYMEKTPTSPIPSIELTLTTIFIVGILLLIRLFTNSFLGFVSNVKGLGNSLNRVELRSISIVGLIGIPLTFFYAFYYDGSSTLLLIFSISLVILYLIRIVILFSSASEFGIPLEYIFLYLCSLEIAPLLAVGLWFTSAERVL